MKTGSILLFLIFFGRSYGQTYLFDKLVNSEFTTIISSHQKRTDLFNSKDYSYFMSIYYQNDSMKSTIFDYKRNKIHDFHIDKKDSLKLKLLKTVSYKTDSIDNPNTYLFSDIKLKKNKKEIEFAILNQKKSKIAKYKLTIRETDQNFFPFFNFSGALETFHLLKIQPPLNFMILQAKGYNSSGRYVMYKFKSIDEINLSVTVP